MRTKEKGRILKFATVAKSLSILLIIFMVFGIAYADPAMSSMLTAKNQHYEVRK